MTVVDAYQAYRYEAVERVLRESTVLDFNDFVSQLSHPLIFSDFAMKRSQRSGTDPDGPEEEEIYGISSSVALVL
ncbi:hypothetical protein PR003_g8156 [Phytophthora rubi]|uniref:Uncharacterized protein n=1 Tax=Phytophthora rubi TaxID=129364 RepID=A0A6A3NLQ5_9STRA|nr:hypothetical protein PR001_g8142 [Phytophthora rubi]KAE9046285.1 hypothetical protein PR002_g1740 [Phytophthora rubi]KAE9345030.1 hypothetical protein PR003_g8156 [Phytophthora rubi]